MKVNVAMIGMTSEIGKTYYRRAKSGHAQVIRVLKVGEWVEYQVVRGPRRAMTLGRGRCKAKNFAGWQEVEERDDYSDLDGCKIFATFLVLDTQGQSILRCSQKRADFYLKKGYVRQVGKEVLQFTNGQTERRLRDLYHGSFSQFFLAVKNDHCVCCGNRTNLSRHHVVPRRHLKKFPQPWRRCLSNVLFVCQGCHRRYEQNPEPDPKIAGDWREYAARWKQHFLDTMNPKFMPVGWDIVSVTNFDAVKECD